MIPKRPPHPKRPIRARRGNRRHIPLDERTTGWRARPRTKVSRMADKGFMYEVRLEHFRAWNVLSDPKANPHAVILTQLRESLDCRIVGPSLTRAKNGYHKGNFRIYVRSDADLFFIRLASNEVFRVYRLVSPSISASADSAAT
jgi:hypothetical protein